MVVVAVDAVVVVAAVDVVAVESSCQSTCTDAAAAGVVAVGWGAAQVVVMAMEE